MIMLPYLGGCCWRLLKGEDEENEDDDAKFNKVAV